MACPRFRRRAIAWHGSLEGRFPVCREVPERSPVGRVGHRLIARELGGMAMGIHAGHIIARVGEVCSVAIPS